MSAGQSPCQIVKQFLPEKKVDVLRLSGELDAHTSKQVQAAINELFAAGHCQLVIDLQNLTYMSSAGAGLFIVVQSEAEEKGGQVVLVNPAPPARYVFDLLGLTAQFRIADTEQAALERF
ncbi:MAG: STAS domain-containing protein [Planctomycetota bacterium]|nr:STAS domain-containing protein [Planctomycetota bacterium]